VAGSAFLRDAYVCGTLESKTLPVSSLDYGEIDVAKPSTDNLQDAKRDWAGRASLYTGFARVKPRTVRTRKLAAE
jgi:hypothetical protein